MQMVRMKTKKEYFSKIKKFIFEFLKMLFLIYELIIMKSLKKFFV